MLDRPHRKCYWVEPGRLLASAYPGERLSSYVQANFNAFIDLTEPGELHPYHAALGAEVSYQRFSILDRGLPRTPAEMTKILDAIDAALAAGRKVCVHCWGGIGRTGTVVGCYLVRHGHTGEQALAQIAEWWQDVATRDWYPRAPETDEQVAYVLNWREPLTRRARYRGCLLGLAAGDALGTTLEFQAPGTFTPIDDMRGGGPFALAPGQWTDDTSMALCLATSLVETKTFDARDQMQRYVRWWREGYLSSTGRCFDIGITVRGALRHYETTDDPFAGSTDPQTAGNGSLMRLAPVPMAYAHQPQLAIERSGESSRTTHGAATAIDACRYFGGLIVGALNGASKEEILAPHYSPIAHHWAAHPLHPAIATIAAGSFKTKQPPEIRGTGYVVASLEAALWALYHSTSFRDGALRAVNLGNDADTTGAIYGQLAGAVYGEHAIPEAWRSPLALRPMLETLAEQLLNFE